MVADRRLVALGDLVAHLVQGLFGLIDDLIGCVAGIDLVLARLILCRILLGFLDCLVDVFLRQVRSSGDGDFCSAPVPRSFAETFTMLLASMSNVTSICGTPRGAGVACQLELAEGLVVSPSRAHPAGHGPHRGLVVCCGREDLALLGRDGGCSASMSGEHAAHGLNAQRQRSDIEQQQTLPRRRRGRRPWICQRRLPRTPSGSMPLKPPLPVSS